MRPFHAFTMADVPVFVSPWFLLLLGFFAFNQGATMGAVVVIAVVASLLVHEFGHALTARRFGLGPNVLLHGFGGLCAHRPAARDRDDALIVAAGPGAGLLLGLACFGTRSALLSFQPQLLAEWVVVDAFLITMIWINFVWSVLNLVPLWPLDGGQLFRLGVLRLVKPATALRIVHGTGIALGIGAIALVLTLPIQAPFAMIIAGLLAWQNWEALQSGGAGQAVRKSAKPKKQRLQAAITAYDQEDFAEAVRICHQVRMQPDCPPEVLREVWPLLGIATFRLGRADEAISFLRRAEMSPQVAQVWFACLAALGRRDEALALLDSPELQALPARVRDQLRARVDAAS